jgi:phosphoribosylaminoimidazole (AIR) synthetase
MIERFGEVPRAEMRTVFNMGIGLTVTVPENEADRATEALRKTGVDAWRLGQAVADPDRQIRIPQEGLLGQSKRFVSSSG